MTPLLQADQLSASILNLESVSWLQPLASFEVYGNSLLSYLTVLVLVLVVGTLARAVSWLLRSYSPLLTGKTQSKLDDVIFKAVEQSVAYVLVLTTLYVGIRSLNFPEMVDDVAFKAFFVLLTLKVAKELEAFVEHLIEQYFVPLARRQKGTLKSFVPPLLRFSRFILWAFAFLLIVHNLGFNISSLLAGLGIGGLAFALGAQETLANLFGSISLLADETFKVGDFVKGGGHTGTVKAVGIRSTKIETMDKTIVSIPNKLLASTSVENITEKEAFKVEQIYGLVYETPLVKLKQAIDSIKQILKKDKDVNSETFRAHFTNFGDSALEVTVFYHITDISTYTRTMDIKERINMKVKETFESLGVEMAFPTQSLYIENANDFIKTPTRRKANK